ncbi:MAG: formamidopyrimidine-DNA glycosylase [Planctomycetales bacterium]|nr:formamidopyrimidine-DNA glycosylase [Planctomycetales bacterium]
MPEYPDICVYVDALERLYVGKTIESVSVRCPFIVRTFAPCLSSVEGQAIRSVRRLGKRIVWEFDADVFVVFHLMIAGRFHRRNAKTKPRSKTDLIAFQCESDTLMLTEVSKKRRASVHVVQGNDALCEHDPAGLEVMTSSVNAFRDRLLGENKTLKRALTNPRNFSGIGNAYSDEILHAAKLSPVRRTKQLNDAEIARLFDATVATLGYWRDLLLEETGEGFPEKVTAFHPKMSVHGKFGHPCPACKTEIQRITYSENETNYCPRCQTEGKLLADRSLSRLLKNDWPKTIDEWENFERGHKFESR